MSVVLQVEKLTKRFGAVTVADGLDFVAVMGQCLGVIGPNGAGKTSVFNLLDGTLRTEFGRILLDGDDITRLPQFERARRGIARAYQIPQSFPDLTVFENVLIAATFAARLSGAAATTWAMNVLECTGLADRWAQTAGALLLLDRKRLELARAIAARPRLLLLDEIAGGLTEPEVQIVIDLVRTLKANHAIIWIEHVAHALVAAADSIMVLNFGAKIGEGEPKAILASPAVREIYLGISVDALA